MGAKVGATWCIEAMQSSQIGSSGPDVKLGQRSLMVSVVNRQQHGCGVVVVRCGSTVCLPVQRS